MKIITYNIHKGMNSDNKITLKEIGRYLKKIDCQIICIQEVLYPQFIKLKSILKLDGVFVANVNKPGMKYGICIFSKLQIEDSKHILLTSIKEQRGLVSISICEKSQNTVNIINTHLGLDRYERYDQISEILDYTKTLSGDVIICGDFNEKNITISGYSDGAIVMNKEDIPTFEKSHARIDYIFIKENLNIVDYYVDKIYLSDHYPVIVKLREDTTI